MTQYSRLTTLLAKAYFPKELPLVFTTSSFGEFASEIIADWEAANLFEKQFGLKLPKNKKAKKSGSYSYKLKATADPEVISAPKRGYERRNLHITHPIPQALLAHELSSNWMTIAKWLARTRFSMDQVQISHRHARGIKPLNFEAHRAKKAYIEAQADWIVKTDITRFYPSIYTHSLAWAAYGKEAVKQKMELYKGSVADRLDLLVRSCNRGQTVGIPIGPETSRILADIISSRVDCDFAEAQGRIDDGQVDRLQDDWFLGAASLHEAEEALSNITATYREYGLDINGSKTAVERIISPIAETWKGELGAFLSHSRTLSRSRLRELLQLTLRLQLENPTAPVVSYALSVIETKRISLQDVEAVESFLIRAAAVAPNALHRICSILINLQHSTKRVSVGRVRDRFTELAERHLPNGNLYEVIWLLFTLRGLKAPLNSRKLCRGAEGVNSSAVILLLLDMESRGLVWSKLPRAAWEDQINPEGIMRDWTWLYAYEATRKGWLRDMRNVQSHPFFSAMAKRDVSFFDPSRNVPPTQKTVAARTRQRKKDTRETLMLLSFLRGFDFGEYGD